MKRVVAAAAQASVLICLCLFLLWWHYAPDLQSIPVENIKDTSSEQEWLQPTSAFSSSTPTSTTTEAQETGTMWNQSTTTVEPTSTQTEEEAAFTSVNDSKLDEATRPIESDGPSHLKNAAKYIKAIMDPDDTHFSRLSCPPPTHDRYLYLKSTPRSQDSPRPKPKYFFALDLHECAPILPRLLGSIVETIRFLGPELCTLSIVEGRSTDGTFEILNTIRKSIAEELGAAYFFTTSPIDPKADGVDRISALADLRNQALLPLTRLPDHYDPETTVIFINDVALCMEDILELIHQRIYQSASMTCAMDWIFAGWSFYDVWVSRTMQGDQFFEIPQSGSWDFADKLFWNDPATKARQDAGRPYQVFSCWNGATAFTAKPLLEHQIEFRANYEGECYLGEPTHFCKDLWYNKYGKIAVIPSVNFGYDDEESRKIKSAHGSVSSWLGRESNTALPLLIDWSDTPPETIKCVPSYQNPTWVPWDEALNKTTSV